MFDQGVVMTETRKVVYGFDISRWQRRINWAAVDRQSFGFCIIRIGVYRSVDPVWPEHYQGAGGAGLLRGAYWAIIPAAYMPDQFEQALEIYMTAQFELPLFFDLEVPHWNGYQGYLKELEEGIRRLDKHNFVRWGIYTNYIFATYNRFHLLQRLADQPLWIAHWNVQKPAVPLPWKGWFIWQYAVAPQRSFRFYQGRLDLDVSTTDKLDTLQKWPYHQIENQTESKPGG